MTIPLTCPCGARLEIDETFAGQTITCPDCQKSLRVPRPEVPGVRTSGLALLSLTLALAGAFTLIGTVAAVALGWVALQQIQRRPDEITGRNYALAGIVLGGLLTAVTGFALFAPELFGLQNLPGQLQWAGRLDYDVPEEIARPNDGYAIKRPSARWGLRRAAKPTGGGEFPAHTWDDLVLVNVAEDAHILVTQLTVAPNATLDECQLKAFEDFQDKDKAEMFGRRRPTPAAGARARVIKEETLPEINNTQVRELEIEKTLAGQERKFLMRVVWERDTTVAFVVVGGARTGNFARVEADVRAALESFRLLRGGLPG
jgi:hypothetical protein